MGGETLEQAAIRESREEGAVEIEALDGLFGVYANFTPYRCDHVALFLSRKWHKTNQRSAEIAEIGFFDANDLPEGTTDATQRRIDEYMGRQPLSRYW